MDHRPHHKRKAEDDPLYTSSSKRTRLSMVPDSTAAPIQTSSSATNESSIMRCAQETSAASSPQTSYQLPPLHDNVLSTPIRTPSATPPPPSASSAQEQASPQVNMFPPITRETLKELDLDVVMGNPRLRHDLLFDPSLQFRTMANARKQLIADQYWEAVLHELEHTLDRFTHSKKRSRPPTPPPWSEKHYSAYLHAATDPQVTDSPNSTVASPPSPGKRVQALLHTLSEVLTYVIGSATSNRNLQLSQILSNIDIVFIDHELRHGLYDPSGLFILMGQLLKAHCAPMRDGKVDIMVAVAKGDLNPSGLFGPRFSTSELLPFTDKQRSIRRTVGCLRSCFEILELMKLDIANHHLHHLRPFLFTSGPDFLYRVFVDKVQRGTKSFKDTQKFLSDAYRNIMSTTREGEVLSTNMGQAMLANIRDICKPNGGSAHTLDGFPQGLKIHLALVASLTDMVFNPPTFDSYVCQCGLVLPMRDLRLRTTDQSNQHVHEFKRHSSAGTNQLSWPETLWLDCNRVAQLIGDAADLTALYVLLMGWRMLVFAKQDDGSSPAVNAERDDGRQDMPLTARFTSKLEDWTIERVKKEVWSIAPRKFGSCFFWDDYSRINDPADAKRPNTVKDAQTRQAWKDGMENVALHIAKRAEDTRREQNDVCDMEQTAGFSERPAQMPSYESVSLLRSWLDTHMRRSSTLTARLRKLVATEVATTAAKMTLHMLSANSTLSQNGVEGSSQATADFFSSTSTAALYKNLTTSPEAKRTSIPSLLNPQTPSSSSPSSRIPHSCHPILPHRSINIVPSPAAVAAGLEPLMPEIKHLASRIAKLTYVNMKIFWSLYTTPGFLDSNQNTAPTPPIVLTPERTCQWDRVMKLEED